jgi:hypothetical protein
MSAQKKIKPMLYRANVKGRLDNYIDLRRAVGFNTGAVGARQA